MVGLLWYGGEVRFFVGVAGRECAVAARWYSRGRHSLTKRLVSEVGAVLYQHN